MKYFVVFLALLFTSKLCTGADVPVDRGVLVFADGNRITGRLAGEGVFVSDRFGEIRFQPDVARFEADWTVLAEDSGGVLRARVEAETKQTVQTRPTSRTAPVWKFDLSGYLDSTLQDGVRHREYYGSLRIERSETGPNKYTLSAQYEYHDHQGLLDKRRATLQGEWRHSFGDTRWFSVYRPGFEYDGRYLSMEAAALLNHNRLNYVFTQQQAGVGYRLFDSATLKSNLIANWNYFYVRVFHLGWLDEDMPSLNIENTLRLRYGFEVAQSGQVYWLPRSQYLLWENHLDLTKHLSDHLFITLRHEYRKNFPVKDANPLARTRVLFGLNF